MPTQRRDVNMGVPEEQWCGDLPPHGIPVETLIAMRNETTVLRKNGLFNFPLPTSIPPASADLVA